MAPKNIDALISELSAPPAPGAPYALPLPNSERPNRSAVYRHFRFRDRPLLTTFDPELQSVHDLFEESVRKGGNKRCLGLRRWDESKRNWLDNYDWMTYNEVAERRKNFGAGVAEIHSRINYPKDKYGVGLWSQNRPEWQIADLAFVSQSLFTVSLYETLGPDATEYIINHAELACVATSLNHIPMLLKLAPRLPTMKIIISLDPLDHGEQDINTKSSLLNEIAGQNGIKIYSMEEVEKIGLESGRPMRPGGWNDIATINYTSGTTGAPKGVILTHGNAVAANSSSRIGGMLSSNDVHISYLPLAHIYGRLVDQLALSMGSAIGYFRGDILGLVDDMKILQPTGFISVPRLFNRFNSAIRTATIEADGIRGALSRRVIDSKKASMRAPPGKANNTHFLYDKIWTPKVRAAVGLQRARTMISGSAQLDPDVQVFLRAAFGNQFFQGYGLTESYANATLQLQDDFSVGNVGPPCAPTEVCLESVPEFDYTVEDKPHPRGELLLRGPCVFTGYYKNEEETKKVLDADGWFHTGDIALIDKLGRVKIIDRKKNVLKLSQGEYISPERIENVYLGNCNLVGTAYVHGDAKESSLVAVFGVDLENFPPWASKIIGETIATDDRAAIKTACDHPKVKAALLKVLDGIARKQKFNSFERVRNVYLDIEPFSIENELFTPTLKLKRPQAAKAFRTQIDQMYAEIAAQTPPNKGKL